MMDRVRGGKNKNEKNLFVKKKNKVFRELKFAPIFIFRCVRGPPGYAVGTGGSEVKRA